MADWSVGDDGEISEWLLAGEVKELTGATVQSIENGIPWHDEGDYRYAVIESCDAPEVVKARSARPASAKYAYRLSRVALLQFEETIRSCNLALLTAGHVQVDEKTIFDWLGKPGYYLLQRGSIILNGAQLYLFEDGADYVVARRDGWNAIAQAKEVS